MILNSSRLRLYLFVYFFILLVLVLYNICKEKEEVKLRNKRKGKSCHFHKTDKDVLPLLLRSTSFPPKSIFFHETTCRGGLSYRQACAVESAALAHPNHQINVLFTSPVLRDYFEQSTMKTLLDSYSNVRFLRVHINSYVEGTPLGHAVIQLTDDQLHVHIARVMTYLTMYKYSGIYLGLDVIVGKSLAELSKNWVVRETPETLSTDMFAFSENHAGRKLAEISIGFLYSEILFNEEHATWSYSGPSVLTRAMQLWCTTDKIQGMSLSSCDDVAVYGPELFYPVSFHNRSEYFHEVDWNKWKDENIYTYHVWEYFTKYNLVTEFSLYSRLAEYYCPTIFTTYFGGIMLKQEFNNFNKNNRVKT